MKTSHIIAFFKSEFYTTTVRFRTYRKRIPILFLIGIIIFGYLIREIYELLRGDREIPVPPISIFFSLISIFSYFTLFAPMLSPLGRIVYDGSAKARREVALNSPVEEQNILIGNLLSNLTFFLPFFVFLGTLILSPFIGNGNYSPFITSLFLCGILVLLILIGLLLGTLISPFIFYIISKQRNDVARALLIIIISLMMVLAIPLLHYITNVVEKSSGNLGILSFLPFTLSTSLIVFVLYGVEVGFSPLICILLLFTYNLIILILGMKFAKKLYQLSDDIPQKNLINQSSKFNWLLSNITKVIPKYYRTTTLSLLKYSTRNIEHISRLTIGLAVAVFMIFTFSAQGLFRDSSFFSGDLELAVVFFGITISSASVIFIEVSSFTIQHRDIFTLIKSSPNGSKRFIISKIFQLIFFLIPLLILLFLGLFFFKIMELNVIPSLLIFVLIFMLFQICISLGIYLINPSDNEEDLTNFINVMVFYLISFFFSSIPLSWVITGNSFTFLSITIWIGILTLIAYFFIIIGINSFDQMDLETLESPISKKIKFVVFILIMQLSLWNIVPLLYITILLKTNNLFYYLFICYTSIIVLNLYFIKIRKDKNLPNINFNGVKQLPMYLIALLAMAFVLISLSNLFPFNFNYEGISTVLILFNLDFNETVILIFLIVIAEELFFRWYIISLSLEYFTQRQSILLSAMLFSLFHLNHPLSIINALFAGILLGHVRLKYNSLFNCILIHFIYNLLIIYGIYSVI